MSAPEPPTSGSGNQAPAGPDDAPPPAGARLDERCAALVKQLRERCPGVLPEAPLPAGTPAKPIPVDPEQYGALVGVAIRQNAAIAALGRLPASDDELPEVVVWEQGASALAVGLGEVQTVVEEGAITVAMPVFCDQLGARRNLVRVTFVVGTRERPAGLLAATPPAPDGPPVVVEGWGDELTALAWQALLDVAAGVAARAGTDTDGTPLVATALAAGRDRLEVLPQARHPFDRLPRTRAVTP
jgi:hypothetical protein